MSFFIRPDLTTDEIEKRESDDSMFRRYCTHFRKENLKFKAEFRKDSNPSASIIRYNDRLWYKDFGDPHQEKSYNIYQFVMEKFNLSFFEALKKINDDFNLGLGYNANNVKAAPVKYEIKKKRIEETKDEEISKLDVRKINWTEEHIKFWTQYDIPRWDLRVLVNLFKIDPISHFWLNTPKINNRMFIVGDIGFTYDYDWHLGILKRKVYLPNKNGSSFFTNSNDVVQGYEQLPEKGDLVFVTSSMKDIVILRACGFYAVAPSNENVFIPEHIFEDLKSRFKNVIIFYDNDFDKDQNWGILFAKKHSERYDIPYIVLPDNTEKDPSDFSKSFGRTKLTYTIKERLIECQK